MPQQYAHRKHGILTQGLLLLAKGNSSFSKQTQVLKASTCQTLIHQL
jgi:hypothetical protein